MPFFNFIILYMFMHMFTKIEKSTNSSCVIQLIILVYLIVVMFKKG